jgi:hypothetical protein
MVTDVGLALLIALPAVLPAAPSPWNSHDDVGKAESPATQTPADSSEWAQSVTASRSDQPRYGRS